MSLVTYRVIRITSILKGKGVALNISKNKIKITKHAAFIKNQYSKSNMRRKNILRRIFYREIKRMI